jgi:hypothetical protein
MSVELFEPPLAKSRRADTTGQASLFPWLHTRSTARSDSPAIVESPTSRAAARRIAPEAPRLYHRILNHFRAVGPFGATDEEGETALQIPGNSYRPRRGTLARDGLITAGGKRPTRSGNAARVWRLAEGRG